MSVQLDITPGDWRWEMDCDSSTSSSVVDWYILRIGDESDINFVIQAAVLKDSSITDDMCLITKSPLLLEACKKMEKDLESRRKYEDHIKKEIDIANESIKKHVKHFEDTVKTYFKLLDDMVERSVLCYELGPVDNKLEEAEKKLRELVGIV